jgi:hypothetical protein
MVTRLVSDLAIVFLWDDGVILPIPCARFLPKGGIFGDCFGTTTCDVVRIAGATFETFNSSLINSSIVLNLKDFMFRLIVDDFGFGTRLGNISSAAAMISEISERMRSQKLSVMSGIGRDHSHDSLETVEVSPGCS